MVRAARGFDVALARFVRARPFWTVVVLVILYTVAWVSTSAAGGTQSALPHLFYVPILVAAVAFGARGGLVAGLVAAWLCGPLMALDTVGGVSQPVTNWVTRGVFFVSIGTIVGGTAAALRRAYEEAIQATIQRQLATELADSRAHRPGPEDHARITQLLLDGRFHVVFQPIYSLDTGGIRAVEALTRFDAPFAEPPDVWFARAARVGLGEQLELAAMERALEDSRVRLASDVALSLNCSPETLCSPRLLTLLETCPERRIVLEITEHARIDDYRRLDAAFELLRRRGVRFAVDDAGAGFASFRHIVRLAPDIIKLDISLTQHVRQDPVRSALADAIVRFARQTGSELIAEGIEEPVDLLTWSELGASAAQGFLLARPGPLPPGEPAVPIPRRVGPQPRALHGVPADLSGT